MALDFNAASAFHATEEGTPYFITQDEARTLVNMHDAGEDFEAWWKDRQEHNEVKSGLIDATAVLIWLGY